jgi:hypothetical protein
MQQIVESHISQSTATGTFRSWQDILSNTNPVSSGISLNVSATGVSLHFSNNSQTELSIATSMREYHPAATSTIAASQATTAPAYSCCQPRPVQLDHDLDGDGLPDDGPPNLSGKTSDGFETVLAKEFMPVYFISTGEQQQFATFGDYVPWTVSSTIGTNPPNSYIHVTPLGLAADQSGNQLYAIRVDYLSLWNADGGLVGGGAACFYSYFGLDSVINQVSGHDLDAERSVMLLAAPAVNGKYNPDPNAYSLYSLYTAAHEGTFFDQSEYADFSTPVPAGNHVDLAQSVSKHSTYGFNPNYYPITPDWFIVDVNEVIDEEYADGDIDDATYAILLAAADDTFYGCLVERFGDQGGQAPNPVINVGEVNHPLNGSTFIEDDSSRALNLADKLNDPVF